MGFVVSRVLTPLVARLGSRTILGVGGALFLINMVIPDPLPLVDEFLMLAGTILLSRMAQRAEARAASATGASGAPGATGAESAAGARGATGAGPKHVGRGSTNKTL